MMKFMRYYKWVCLGFAILCAGIAIASAKTGIYDGWFWLNVLCNVPMNAAMFYINRRA